MADSGIQTARLSGASLLDSALAEGAGWTVHASTLDPEIRKCEPAYMGHAPRHDGADGLPSQFGGHLILQGIRAAFTAVRCPTMAWSSRALDASLRDGLSTGEQAEPAREPNLAP